jgi:hypothetical protein
MKASVRKRPGLHERERLGAVRLQDPGGGDEHHHGQGHEDDPDRLELAPEVGQRPLLDRLGDLDHLRRAPVGGEHPLHEEEADGDGDQRGGAREDEPEPLRAPELEGLVAPLGGEHMKHR